MSQEHQTNQLSQAAENKKRIVKLVDSGLTISKEYSFSETALMFGIPANVLEKSAVSLTPRSEGVEVTFGPDTNRHLDNLADWLKENRVESQELLEESYRFLFLAGQAAGIPSVNFKEIIKAEGPRMEVLESIVPEIKGLKEHLNQGGRIQDIIREDNDYWGGLVYACYQNLSCPRQEELKSKGMSPEYMFQSSD